MINQWPILATSLHVKYFCWEVKICVISKSIRLVHRQHRKGVSLDNFCLQHFCQLLINHNEIVTLRLQKIEVLQVRKSIKYFLIFTKHLHKWNYFSLDLFTL